MTGAEWTKLAITALVALLGGGALARYLVPSVRRGEAANADRTAAEAHKFAAEKVGSEVMAVRTALEAVQETLVSQRTEFTARDAEKAAQISVLRQEIKSVKAVMRAYMDWSKPAITAWRDQHPDYPDPPQIEAD